MNLEADDLREAKDYPEEDGYYWVFRLNRDGEIDSVDKLEFIQLDEEYPSIWQGWENIQYEVEHDTYKYYWTKELKICATA